MTIKHLLSAPQNAKALSERTFLFQSICLLQRLLKDIVKSKAIQPPFLNKFLLFILVIMIITRGLAVEQNILFSVCIVQGVNDRETERATRIPCGGLAGLAQITLQNNAEDSGGSHVTCPEFMLPLFPSNELNSSFIRVSVLRITYSRESGHRAFCLS